MDEARALHGVCKLPPLRGLKDFLLEPSGFQLPNFNDFEKWGNRVVNNLIYYQTNYVYMLLCILLVIGCLHPRELLLGVLWGLLVYLVVVFENEEMCKLRREYPGFHTTCVVICILLALYIGSSILFVLLFTVLLLVSVTFIHASLRLRNMKNKLVNKIEGIGLERTPMGMLLKYFVFETIASLP
ncbi:PRA1 family protein Jwa isoform X2 [Lasioglossum baleicum]|uniref:PRA1 family protein Jwa isoform X2 n=1 Tax=Lasioglossum baleicum TaxID=434251 RepID=UPI003FCED366